MSDKIRLAVVGLGGRSDREKRKTKAGNHTELQRNPGKNRALRGGFRKRKPPLPSEKLSQQKRGKLSDPRAGTDRQTVEDQPGRQLH